MSRHASIAASDRVLLPRGIQPVTLRNLAKSVGVIRFSPASDRPNDSMTGHLPPVHLLLPEITVADTCPC